MTDTFIREVPLDKITDKMVADYEARGLQIRYKDDSIEIWASDDKGE